MRVGSLVIIRREWRKIEKLGNRLQTRRMSVSQIKEKFFKKL